MDRITRKNLEGTFASYVDTLRRYGLHPDGKLVLSIGSKTYGRAYRINLVPPGESGHYRPGIGDDFLGMTTREAWETLADRRRIVADVVQILEDSGRLAPNGGRGEPMSNYTETEIVAAATACGSDHGRNAGAWVLDGNSDEATARRILEGIAEGDQEIMDMMPAPLSGEWAGESVPELVHASGLDWDRLHTDDMADRNDVDTWADAYEEAFSAAYWAEVERAARYIAEGVNA